MRSTVIAESAPIAPKQRHRFTVALTGGIASGKSAVTDRFAAHGIEIIDADLISRELVEPGAPALQEIVSTFGAEVINADGSLNRRALRERVFGDVSARRALESILHPRVRDCVRQRAQSVGSAYGLIVIPLLLESGDYAWVNRVLVVDVTPATQVQRLIERDGIDRTLAESMLAAQAGRAERLAIADDVIDNSTSLADLDAKVARLHHTYLALARPDSTD